MSDYFLGEIRVFGFGWAPKGWALCDGAILPMSQYQALYALLGNTYGGSAGSSFALPDLRGRVPLGQGPSQVPPGTLYRTGNTCGTETVTLSSAQNAPHYHLVAAASNTTATGAAGSPSDNFISNVPTTGHPLFAAPGTPTAINPGTVSVTGGAPHNNMQPFSVVNFCISTSGLWPPRP